MSFSEREKKLEDYWKQHHSILFLDDLLWHYLSLFSKSIYPKDLWFRLTFKWEQLQQTVILKSSFLLSFDFSHLLPLSLFSLCLFQKYPAQTQSSVHSPLPQNAPLSQVCLSSAITMSILFFLACVLVHLRYRNGGRISINNIGLIPTSQVNCTSSANSRGEGYWEGNLICEKVQMCQI